MNIEKITLGQIKELREILNPEKATASSAVMECSIGRYVIVRSRNEGINAGVVEAADETGVVLNGCRRLWHHKPAVKSTSWYEGVAEHGLSADSTVSTTVSKKVIVEDYSITLCTETARQSIEAAVPNAQN